MLKENCSRNPDERWLKRQVLLITLRVSIALQLLKAKKVVKGAEVFEMLAKNFNTLFFPQQPLPKLPKTML